MRTDVSIVHCSQWRSRQQALLEDNWRTSTLIKVPSLRKETKGPFSLTKTLLRAEDRHLYSVDYECTYKRIPQQLFIQPEQMKPCECIGSGQYGVVYKAILNGDEGMQDVAVKTLKGASF